MRAQLRQRKGRERTAIALTRPKLFAPELSLSGPSLFHVEQLYIEDQRGIGRNQPVAHALLSIGKVRRNTQLPLAADLHSGHALVPSLDHLPRAQHEFKGTSRPDRTVKLLSVGEPARVVNLHLVTGLRHRARARLDVPVLETAGGFSGSACNLRRPSRRLLCRS